MAGTPKAVSSKFAECGRVVTNTTVRYGLKGTQDKKNFLIGPVLGEVRFFHVVLRLRGMKKNFELGQKNIFSFFHLCTLYMSQY
jgi:hypothetical protein